MDKLLKVLQSKNETSYKDYDRILTLTTQLVALYKIEARILKELRDLTQEVLENNERDSTSIRLDELSLSTRTYNRLTAKGMETVADVLAYPKNQWHKIRAFGPNSAGELEREMAKLGYTDFKICFRYSCK